MQKLVIVMGIDGGDDFINENYLELGWRVVSLTPIVNFESTGTLAVLLEKDGE